MPTRNRTWNEKPLRTNVQHAFMHKYIFIYIYSDICVLVLWIEVLIFSYGILPFIKLLHIFLRILEGRLQIVEPRMECWKCALVGTSMRVLKMKRMLHHLHICMKGKQEVWVYELNNTIIWSEWNRNSHGMELPNKFHVNSEWLSLQWRTHARIHNTI